MNKPREWYLKVNGLSGNEVHVIEYSAYQALRAELDRQKELPQKCKVFTDRIAELELELTKEKSK